MTSKQVTSPPWNSRRLQQRNGLGIALVGPCSHSIGKFFLCYTVFFPFWNFRPRLARELHVCLVYIALNSKNLPNCTTCMTELHAFTQREISVLLLPMALLSAIWFYLLLKAQAPFPHSAQSRRDGQDMPGKAPVPFLQPVPLSQRDVQDASCLLSLSPATSRVSPGTEKFKSAIDLCGHGSTQQLGTVCDQLGTFSSKYEKRAEVCGVQSVWREYMLFHNSCRFRTDCAVLRWQCADEDFCGGIADQQRGLVSALLIAIITKRMLLVHWQRFGVNIQSTVLFAPGMIDTRASPLYADRCKTLQHEAPLQSIDPRTTREADRIVKTVKESKKLCLGLQTNLKPELLLASSAAKGFEGFKGFYDLPLRGCAHRFMFKPGNSVWALNKTVSGPQMGIHLRLGDQVGFAKLEASSF